MDQRQSERASGEVHQTGFGRRGESQSLTDWVGWRGECGVWEALCSLALGPWPFGLEAFGSQVQGADSCLLSALSHEPWAVGFHQTRAARIARVFTPMAHVPWPTADS